VTGQALNLEEDNIGAVIFGDYLILREGDEVRRTGRVLEVPVGPALVGRVVDALGRPVTDWPAPRHEESQGGHRRAGIINAASRKRAAPDGDQGDRLR